MSDTKSLATFAGGCFWGVEHHFRHIPGVLDTSVGYMGGSTSQPTYREVCTGATGHAEVLQIEFDPSVVSYEVLLAEFWRIHDPTTLNRQGPDIGTQYRSAIFFHSEDQKAAAEKSRAEFQPRFKRPIVTEISPAGDYWIAEDYHQQYLEKTGRPSCHLPNW